MSGGIILHVEDNASNRKLVRDLLASRGYRLVEAETGEEALALAERVHPRLVLMDLQLPTLSGLAVTERLRAHAELGQVPIVAVTALALRADLERARAAGCDAVLTKPYEPLELLRLVERFFGPPPAPGGTGDAEDRTGSGR
jgi:two-component system cell cycle response regulator DivK